ncbi:MAG: methyltransferase domain-containing protein [Ignavibacteriales bacterium]|nr:methyltransferase domain-containing protein [Ignavibacteriales bacterium]
MKDINSPSVNDNRNYDYKDCPEENRREYDYFIKTIPNGAKVLDLGCGNGSLMKQLETVKQIKTHGIELSKSGVAVCKDKGLQVTEGRIDEALPFPNKSFDYAICNVTIQMVQYPEVLLREMKRVANHQIITFPNFGFYKNRIEMLFMGRMPRKALFGYSWYSTGHIHQLSTLDFRELVSDIGGLQILEETTMPHGNSMVAALQRQFPNLLNVLSIFRLTAQL